MDSAVSFLFVPGDRPDRYEKALAAGAARVVVDFEDAVADARKDFARDRFLRWVQPGREVLVRVNAAGSRWFEDDCLLARTEGVAGVLLPKAEIPSDILALRRAGVSKPVLPIVETATGFVRVAAIARAPGVERLVFGSVDFQLDLGMSARGEELLAYRSAIVLASRVAGVAAPLDGPWEDLRDPEGLRLSAQSAKRLGFGGKLCIHPEQVGIVEAAFRPGREEVEWARRVTAAFAEQPTGALAIDGRMVDRPVLARARRILARADVPTTGL